LVTRCTPTKRSFSSMSLDLTRFTLTFAISAVAFAPSQGMIH
jgi:hypothetical protein